jgi:hypothetical protein
MSPFPPSSSARWKSSWARCAFASARASAARACSIAFADVSTDSRELATPAWAAENAPRAVARVTFAFASASAACARAVSSSPCAWATRICASCGSISAISCPRFTGWFSTMATFSTWPATRAATGTTSAAICASSVVSFPAVTNEKMR